MVFTVVGCDCFIEDKVKYLTNRTPVSRDVPTLWGNVSADSAAESKDSLKRFTTPGVFRF